MPKISKVTSVTDILSPAMIYYYQTHPVEFVEDQIFNKKAKINGGKFFVTDQQADFLNSLVTSKRVSVKAGRGVGKAQPHDTLIYTPSGPVLFGDLKVGDEVFGSDGYPTEVIGVYEQGEREVYEVTFDDGTKTKCCKEHLWNVKDRQCRRKNLDWKTVELQDIINSGVKREFKSGRQDRQWEVPFINSPVQYDTRVCLIDPYVLGAWLGDGCRNKSEITNKDIEVINKIRENREIYQTKYDEIQWVIPGLKKDLKKLGISSCYSYEKYIPDNYKYNSARVRKEILRGLLDTDGTVTERGVIRYGSTSEQLCDDVIEVARSLGYKVNKDSKVKKTFYKDKSGNKVDCRDFYRCTISPYNGEKMFYIKRKQSRVSDKAFRYYGKKWIDSIERVGKSKTRCIKVSADDHLYLTSDFITTHNTGSLAFAVIWWHTLFSHARSAVFSPSFGQLQSVMWPELAKWISVSTVADCFEHTATRLYLKEDPKLNFSEPRTANKPEAARGLHADNLMIIIDEASGVEDEIYNVLSGSLTGGLTNKIVLMTNPSKTSGFSYDSHNKFKRFWTRFTFSSEDSPIVDKEWLREWKEKYVTPTFVHDMYKIEALGEYPDGSADSFLTLSEVKAAAIRDVPKEGPIEIGLDVARKGNDLTVACVRQGLYVYSGEDLGYFEVDPLSDNRHLVTAGKTTKTYESVAFLLDLVDRVRDLTGYDDIIRVKVDDTGVGGGVSDDLELDDAHNIEVIPVVFSQKRCDTYFDVPSRMWGNIKNYIDRMHIPNDPNLIEELATRRWTLDRHLIHIESKDKFKHDYGASPDRADALILAFADIEHEHRYIKAYDRRDTENNGRSSAEMRSGIKYCCVWATSNQQAAAIWATWFNGEIRIIDEFVGDTSEVINVIGLNGSVSKVIGSPNMFSIGDSDMYLYFMDRGVLLQEPYGYNEIASINNLATIAKDKRLQIAEECTQVANQLRKWSDKVSGKELKESYGLCYAMTLVVAELISNNSIAVMGSSGKLSYSMVNRNPHMNINDGWMGV